MATFLRFSLILFVCFFSVESIAEINVDRVEVNDRFEAELATVINNILTEPDSVVQQLGVIVVRVLYFALLFFAIARFVLVGFSFDLLTPVFIAFILGILTETYMIWTSGIFAFFDVSALGLQEIAVGTDSRWYLSTYIGALWDRIEITPVTIFDSIEILIFFGITILCQIILEIVISISEIYANFGFALAQIIGPVFLPFIIHPSTRFLFDRWLSLMLSMAVFAFVVRCVGVVYSLLTMAMIGHFDSSQTLDSTVLVDPMSDGGVMTMLIINSVVGIIFILGAGKISSSIAGGVGSSGFSNSAMRGGMKLAAKVLGKFI
ncbi:MULTISPECIES: type IV secretion system protein [unclassified Pseudoalteromonas]|uniref:type IV secretion system protein n=1 Tax=unclassified Pseudoalteromonas TaxID=194690 RepID=UPI001F211183|nr:MULTISPECIES: type IV secretion system protein [unclassified Pseudoalteromonas]MCF2829705.1 type IV secretion system protein [Pseudoalteromonas sp. OF5H-5]MCF2832611.1 type IV secretion system protein [Pseudoalteromonas sp. DL2-H6]MCF2927595.1 type IV secretion system protein [Pseudoalteromonas sp. DL2-H1]